ncbi:uncharacterized protein LOC131673600 [Phymastichus coffea]|uniref:uncharacterized protein LOC131673600 n=1 Tax=Phymastichus coffea TaxID=108790 RepID=UPI00273BE2CF|nr:uncharacterized protein LOC131673600 [Phymastichus coffea]
MRIAIPAIAKFHAIGLAMKEKNPKFLATMKKRARPADEPRAGGKVDRVKFFDFQSYCFASPMTDLPHFIFASMRRQFEDFDELTELCRVTVGDVLR